MPAGHRYEAPGGGGRLKTTRFPHGVKRKSNGTTLCILTDPLICPLPASRSHERENCLGVSHPEALPQSERKRAGCFSVREAATAAPRAARD